MYNVSILFVDIKICMLIVELFVKKLRSHLFMQIIINYKSIDIVTLVQVMNTIVIIECSNIF